MGHRALVAVEGSDGRYACYRSQWGGLAVEETAGRLVSAVAEAVIDGRPVARDCRVAGVCDAVAPRTDEALFVASRDGDVEAFLVVWIGLVCRSGIVDDGRAAALVPVTDAAWARRVRRSLLVRRNALGAAVDDGPLSPALALATLRASVAQKAAPTRPVWLPLGGGSAG